MKSNWNTFWFTSSKYILKDSWCICNTVFIFMSDAWIEAWRQELELIKTKWCFYSRKYVDKFVSDPVWNNKTIQHFLCRRMSLCATFGSLWVQEPHIYLIIAPFQQNENILVMLVFFCLCGISKLCGFRSIFYIRAGLHGVLCISTFSCP